MDDDKKNVTVSFLLGAAIGAGAAYFLSENGRKKTPQLYEYLKSSLEDLAEHPQESLQNVEHEVQQKAVELKDTVSETVDNIKTIGALNIDKLIPRDETKTPDESAEKEPAIDSKSTVSEAEPVKKPRRFFKKR